MTINSKDCRVREGDEVNLRKWPTNRAPVCKSKEDYQEMREAHVAKLSALQHLHYASNRHAILLIFQAMDAAGKDGAFRHVMSGVNPQGCQVFSFKHPSATELQHDFLWRTTRDLPERGRIGIYNRCYYEEVLIARGPRRGDCRRLVFDGSRHASRHSPARLPQKWHCQSHGLHPE
jgi:polyphosphate kinase 2 (PPK2 family)